MNILISSISSEYVADWVAGLLDALVVQQCVAVFVQEEISEKSRLGRDYVTLQLDHFDCRQAKYNLKEKYNIPPVDEEMLTRMESFEGIWFWMSERDRGSYQSRWRDYCEHIRIWNYILDNFHIDVFLSVGPPHEMFDYIIYALCKIKGIHFCCSMHSKFLGYSYIVNDLNEQLTGIETYIKKLQEKYKMSSIDDIDLDNMNAVFEYYYNQNDISPWYMEEIRNRYLIWRNLKTKLYRFLKRKWKLRILFSLSTYKALFGMLYNSERLRFLQIIWRRIGKVIWEILHLCSFNLDIYSYAEYISYKSDFLREYDILLEYYQKNSKTIDYTQKYIYVPLQAQPELSSSPLGGRYVDQLLMIQMLAYCLPEGYYLYVKEHPAQIIKERYQYQFRTASFYQELLKIPNVRLVSLKEDTYKLIKKSCAVAAVTGTVGIEALVYNRLFLMFGSYYTQYAPNTITIRTLEDCFAAMKIVKDFKQDPNELKKQFKIFLKALEKYFFKGMHYTNGNLLRILPEEYWMESKKNLINRFYIDIVNSLKCKG